MPRLVITERRPAPSAALRSLTRAIAGLAAAAVCALARPAGAEAQVLTAHPEWGAAFDSAGVRGTFVLRRIGSVVDSAYHVLDSARARHPYIPASTFKIPNSLLALELGVVRDEWQRFPFTWPRSEIADWNREHTFQTALKYSVVPVYQGIAREIGAARYAYWLPRLEYGNREIGDRVDRFWLDGPLRISALAQTDFITRLARLELPLSERSQRIVHAMLVREANPCYTLRAKTGLIGVAARQLPAADQVGWYVGWVETDSARWAFAMNVDAAAPGAAAARQRVTKAVLAQAGVIPARGCAG